MTEDAVTVEEAINEMRLAISSMIPKMPIEGTELWKKFQNVIDCHERQIEQLEDLADAMSNLPAGSYVHFENEIHDGRTIPTACLFLRAPEDGWPPPIRETERFEPKPVGVSSDSAENLIPLLIGMLRNYR